MDCAQCRGLVEQSCPPQPALGRAQRLADRHGCWRPPLHNFILHWLRPPASCSPGHSDWHGNHRSQSVLFNSLRTEHLHDWQCWFNSFNKWKTKSCFLTGRNGDRLDVILLQTSCGAKNQWCRHIMTSSSCENKWRTTWWEQRWFSELFMSFCSQIQLPGSNGCFTDIKFMKFNLLQYQYGFELIFQNE